MDIGSQVNVPGTRGKGILRYTGSIQNKQGIFAGLELLGPIAITRGKNSGDVEGRQYFNVQQPMTGLFLPFERLRSVNPGLDYVHDMYNDGISRPTSGGDTNIPRPSSRSSYGSYTAMGEFGRRGSGSSTAGSDGSTSPFLGAPAVSIPKRGSDRSHSSLSNKSPLTNFRSVSELKTSPLNRRVAHNYLEQELRDLRYKYDKNERDMMQKLMILDDLRTTVQDLQPLLRQYETELTDKDRKIAKIRNEFDSAREEWRQNLDLMVTTYEENENFYEQKIRQLQLEVGKQNSNENLAEINKLQVKFDDLLNQKLEGEGNFKTKLVEKDSQIKELEVKLQGFLGQDNQISKLTEELEGLRVVSGTPEKKKKLNEYEKLKIDVIDKDMYIAKLEGEVNNFQRYGNDVGEISGRRDKSNEFEEKEKELRDEIDILKRENDTLKGENHHLQHRTNDTITQLQKEVEKKTAETLDLKEYHIKQQSSHPNPDTTIKDLQEDLGFKNQEILAVQQQLNKANTNVTNQKQTIKSLESQIQSMDPQTQTIAQVVSRFEKDQKSYITQLDCRDNTIKDLERTIQELERKLQEALNNEIHTLNLNEAAVMTESAYKEELSQLKREIDSRPTASELTELQDNIDEMLRLHNNEIYFKQEELQKLMAENQKLHQRLERALEGSVVANRLSDNISHESITSELPIYKPDIQLDPGHGKDNWCGLCEREGHSSLNCPYENEIF